MRFFWGADPARFVEGRAALGTARFYGLTVRGVFVGVVRVRLFDR